VNTYRLGSSPLVFAPGIVAWAINGYKFPKDRKAVANVLCQTWNLTENCAKALLSGAVSYTVEDDAVVFEFDGQAVVA
jgi:hypothetical protein